ncbi:MAG: EamA family transporter [Rhodobacteraceae bacterium]|nr:EamA family transporter [Paracoccaceae bacterium]
MNGGVFAVVMLAAALHAGWNALVKGGADKSAAMVAVVLGQGLLGALLLPFVPFPAPESWPLLLGSVALHIFYQVFLIQSYRFGDLTQVYPVARGVAPLLVALTSALVLGVTFSGLEMLAIAMISIGIASVSLVRRGDGMVQGKAAILALITGCFIAAYSVTDGQGARLAGTALGYFGLLAMLDAVIFAGFAQVFRPGLLGRALRQRRSLLLGGGASFIAYALVVWAFTQAPIALVTALRETSIIFALMIGVFLLGERLSLTKVLSTALTLAGAILLRVGRV